MPLVHVPLESSRLRLEVPRPSHAPEIFRSFASDPEVTRYLRWLPARSLADSEAAMRGRLERLASGEELSWILVSKADGSVVGSFSLWPRDREVEIGFAFARSAWGRGLAVEAARAVLAWLRAEPSVRRVWASCDVDNARSRRVLEKLGFAYERRAEAFAVHPALGDAPRACHVLSLDWSSG